LNGKLLTNGTNTQSPVANFFAGPDGERGGVRVVAADTDFDGRADIITGQNAGTAEAVRIFVSPPALGGSPAASASANPFGVGTTSAVYVG
jgi:hypothetical protein